MIKITSKIVTKNSNTIRETCDLRPLVMHLVYSFNVGGLENGIVNLINRMNPALFRHIVVSMTECDDVFCRRIQHHDVAFLSLHKAPGNGYKIYPLLYRIFREYRPTIIHTRNLAALETVVPAFLARIPVRIHSEHGWDINDPGGTNPYYSRIRRLYRPFVHHFIALSEQIAHYLERKVKVNPKRLTRIRNGVDTIKFHPNNGNKRVLIDSPFKDSNLVIMGTVGRLQAVKDQVTLIQAFDEARRISGAALNNLRLIIVGDGPLKGEIEKAIATHNLGAYVWLAGERADIPALLQAFDFFILPSRAEGISNTILEAMACGLAVIATNVGGNAELVVEEKTGSLVTAGDAISMASVISRITINASQRQQQGKAARVQAETKFSLDGMVEQYSRLYKSLINQR